MICKDVFCQHGLSTQFSTKGTGKHMHGRILLIYATALISLALIIGCGGTKETVTTLPEESAEISEAVVDTAISEEVVTEPVVETGTIVEIKDTAVQLTSGAIDNGFASYSPDGREIVFQSNRDGIWQIYRMDLNDLTETRLIESEANDENPVWTQDGALLLFVSDRGSQGVEWNRDIYSFNPVDGTIIRLTDSPGDDWSPIPVDDISFIFLSERGSSQDVPVYHRKNCLYKGFYNGDPPELVADEEVDPSSPAVLVDGRFAFRDSEGHIVILDPLNMESERVTPSTMHCGFISADKTDGWLVFTARLSDKYSIYIFDPLTRTIQSIVTEAGDVRIPHFAPDTSALIYTATIGDHFQIFEQKISR